MWTTKLNIDELLARILSDSRVRESRVLLGGIYKDEPIVRTGRQVFGGKDGLPKVSVELRVDAPGSRPAGRGRTSSGSSRKGHGGSRKGSGGSYSASLGPLTLDLDFDPLPEEGSSAPAGSRRDREQPHGHRSGHEQPSDWNIPSWAREWSPARAMADGTAKVPERIAQMRRLARSSAFWGSSYANPRLFYEQARLMEDYEDDFPFQGGFERYYPTYEDMNNVQLRGYFSWRTRWRAGDVPDAPLSFLFVHAYELLCGVGTQPGEKGLADLLRLREAYASRLGNEALATYLSVWTSDYVTYHSLDRALLGRDAEGTPLERAVGCLGRAEEALLATASPGAWDASAPGVPSEEDLAFALAAASRYRLEGSRCFSDHFEELAECCCRVFARMVDHCHRRRKRGFVEGLFGGPSAVPYTMFRSAVFHDPAPHPDVEVRLKSGVTYRCRAGAWTVLHPHKSGERSAELGDILHEVDRVLRERIGGIPALKPREVPKYVGAIIEDEVAACLARRAAEEAARVRIDRSLLVGIRSASVRTREALLVDEERGDVAEATGKVPGMVPQDAREEETPRASSSAAVPLSSAAPAQEPSTSSSTAAAPDDEAAADTDEATASLGLVPGDVAFLRALLQGDPAPTPPGTMVSLVVDRINEALFDLVGDTVIEFCGDDPRIIDDYADDVREALA